MLTSFLVVQISLLLLIPLGVGLWLNRRLGLSWFLFLGGSLAFVVGWMISAFVPGQLSLVVAAIAQMGVLYLIYRFLLPTVNTEREALMVGAGQAGIEILIFAAFLAIPTFTQMRNLRNASDDTIIDLIARTDNVSVEEVTPARIDEVRESIDDYWSRHWITPLLETIASLAIVPVQLALAVIVLGSLTHNTLRPLVGAIALFFLAKIVPLFATFLAGIVLGLSLSLVVGGVAIWFLLRLWPDIRRQTDAALSAPRIVKKKARRTQ